MGKSVVTLMDEETGERRVAVYDSDTGQYALVEAETAPGDLTVQGVEQAAQPQPIERQAQDVRSGLMSQRVKDKTQELVAGGMEPGQAKSKAVHAIAAEDNPALFKQHAAREKGEPLTGVGAAFGRGVQTMAGQYHSLPDLAAYGATYLTPGSGAEQEETRRLIGLEMAKKHLAYNPPETLLAQEDQPAASVLGQSLDAAIAPARLARGGLQAIAKGTSAARSKLLPESMRHTALSKRIRKFRNPEVKKAYRPFHRALQAEEGIVKAKAEDSIRAIQNKIKDYERRRSALEAEAAKLDADVARLTGRAAAMPDEARKAGIAKAESKYRQRMTDLPINKPRARAKQVRKAETKRRTALKLTEEVDVPKATRRAEDVTSQAEALELQASRKRGKAQGLTEKIERSPLEHARVIAEQRRAMQAATQRKTKGVQGLLKQIDEEGILSATRSAETAGALAAVSASGGGITPYVASKGAGAVVRFMQVAGPKSRAILDSVERTMGVGGSIVNAIELGANADDFYEELAKRVEADPEARKELAEARLE